jgi:hypothetical protein
MAGLWQVHLLRAMVEMGYLESVKFANCLQIERQPYKEKPPLCTSLVGCGAI